MLRKIKTGMLHRTLTLDRAKVDKDSRSVPLAFSSEEPYRRWFGTEILDHKKSSVRLDRLKKNGPLLVGHDPDDHVGIVEEVTLGADLTGRAVVRFGKSARAEEIYQDVLDGIRKSVSVGYIVHKMVMEEENEDNAIYRATDWEPLEVSVVSIPADTTVGVGRDEQFKEHETVTEDNQMKVCTHCQRSLQENESCDCKTKKVEVKEVIKDASIAQLDTAREEAKKDERARVSEITALGVLHKMGDFATEHIGKGSSIDEFRAEVLVKLGKLVPATSSDNPDLGMSERELADYSIVDGIRALAFPADKRAQEKAKFVQEVSGAVADKLRKAPTGFFIPVDVQQRGKQKVSQEELNRAMFDALQRDLSVGTASAGGYLKGTDHLGSEFINMLRNAMKVKALGARVLDGLVGDIAIPKQTGGATAYWVAEAGDVTESQQVFAQVTMSPKTVGAFTDFSRQLILQSSPAIENLVRGDLATQVGIEIDRVAIHGTGASNQPTGILATSGIGDVAGGANGLAPSYVHMVSLWKEVAQDNALLGDMGWLTNAIMVAKLLQTEKWSGTGKPVIENLPNSDGMTSMLGTRLATSNQVSSTLTKGTSSDCSAVIFGNFSDLMIGQWGAMDVLIDPYTGGIAGTVRIVLMQSMDLAVRNAQSFSAMKDARDV